MGRKKYFAALAAAGMIGAMALGSAFNSYAADGWTKSNDHWTYIYQGRPIQVGWKPVMANIIWTFPMDI